MNDNAGNPNDWMPTPDGPITIDGLRGLSVVDLLELPTRRYLVKGWTSPNELSLIVGAKNSCKTFLGLHVGYAVAQGRSIFGLRVHQTPVLYALAEGEAGIAKRVTALRNKYGGCDAFHVIAQPIGLLHCDLAQASGHLAALVKVARMLNTGWIFIDTVSRALAGGEENSPADMGKFLENMNALRDATGAHVTGIHHGTQADGIKSRGHSVLPFGVDAIMQVEALNKVEVVDIGLRLTDVEEMDLESEPQSTSGDWWKRAETLERHGAAQAEIDFLRNRRVELNAMASDVFTRFLERKFREHDVQKAVPAADVVARHAREIIIRSIVNRSLEDIRATAETEAENTELPSDLTAQVELLLQQEPELPWDYAVAEIVQNRSQ